MLEQQTRLDEGEGLEVIPNFDTTIVNLEHILPQSPSEAWSHVRDEEVDAYSKRIGNLTILDKKLNLDAGNNGFERKKTIYKDSCFLLTSSLKDYDRWDKDTIEARQTKLAELALKVWPI